MFLESGFSGLLHENWQLLMSTPIRMAADTQHLGLLCCPTGYIMLFYAPLCTMFAWMNSSCWISLPEPMCHDKDSSPWHHGFSEKLRFKAKV